jgi:hypothetical protein
MPKCVWASPNTSLMGKWVDMEKEEACSIFVIPAIRKDLLLI